MVHQIPVGVHIVAAAETIGLATVAGLEIQPLHSKIMSTDGASWLFGQRVPHMMALDGPQFSSLGIILTDLVSNLPSRKSKSASNAWLTH
jgi:3-hydroxyisobutyrate dehydrogenase-like beta-hydroxyacid dehydrogenase